jgi:ElaB/YqjD/DUF883 family membrane-anchored ribosome-binding protein
MAASKKEEDFKQKAEEKIDALKQSYHEYKHSLVEYTQKNPITALALAAVTGILLGACWNALRSKK